MAHTATNATKPSKPDQLSVGSRVFYPGHGVALVAGVENRELGSERQQFYVLELARGGKLLLPTGNVEIAGVRSLVSPSAARKLMKSVCTEPDADEIGWKDRVDSFADALRGGEADQYTAVLQHLLFRAQSDKLSAAERRLLETARTYFVAELGAVLERTPEQIAEQLAASADAEPKN